MCYCFLIANAVQFIKFLCFLYSISIEVSIYTILLPFLCFDMLVTNKVYAELAAVFEQRSKNGRIFFNRKLLPFGTNNSVMCSVNFV